MCIMNVIYGTKKYGADKIALLGLFIVALLIARFIIASKSAIVLSEPIKLHHTGLSVSIPAGNGWQSEKQWKYYKNAFALSSFFDSGSGSMTALARCRYLLAATGAAVDTVFKEKTSAIGGAIANTGQIQIDIPGSALVIIDWVHVKKPKALFDTFLGITQLPNSRRLDIEVYQAGGDTDFAERVFRRMAESLEFEGSQPLEAGCEIIAAIKSKGLGSFWGSHFAKEARNGVPLDNRSWESLFLIKDARGRSIGFTMDVLIAAPVLQEERKTGPLDFGRDAQNVQAASFYYIRGRYNREQATFFQGRNNLDEFTWKSETSGIGGRSSAEVVLDGAGVITVSSPSGVHRTATGRKFGVKAEDKSYQIGSAAIPDIFGELTFSQMLDSNHEEILVDIIEADGTIMPVLISRIEKNGSAAGQFFSEAAAQEQVSYVLRLELLDGRGFSEQMYLDDQRRILKRLLRREGIYILERTSAETILREFPERGDYILQKGKMLEQGR